jgi:hypothetical protein
MGLAPRRRHRIAAHGNLGDIELLELEGTVKRLLRLQRHRGDIAALDRGAAVEDGARTIVIADGEAQLQVHVRFLQTSIRHTRACPGTRDDGGSAQSKARGNYVPW